MRRRLLLSMLLVALIALVGFGVPLALTVQSRQIDESLLVLSAEAARAAVDVPGSFGVENDRPELPDPGSNISTALYDLDGRLVVGDGPPTADPTVAAALRAGTVQQSSTELVVALPVSHEEQVVGAIRTRMDPALVTDRVHRTWLSMAALAGGVLAAAGALAVARSRHLARPMVRLRDAARALGKRRPDAPRPRHRNRRDRRRRRRPAHRSRTRTRRHGPRTRVQRRRRPPATDPHRLAPAPARDRTAAPP